MSLKHPLAERFFRLAAEAAQFLSDDPNTRLGSVAVGKQGHVIDANRLVRGAPPEWKDRLRDDRDFKMSVMQHAETSAILAAHRIGIVPKDLFCTWAACPACARVIVDSGVKTVHTFSDAKLGGCPARWREDVTRGREILAACGVAVVEYGDEDFVLNEGFVFDGRMIYV